MKFFEIIHFSFGVFSRHKKRSCGILVLLALTFGMVMGIGFVLQGLEQSLLAAATTQTDGRAYLAIGCGSIECSKREETIMYEQLEKYHGYVAGELTEYQSPKIDGYYSVLSSNMVADYIDMDLEKLSENQIPFLAPALMNAGEVVELLAMSNFDTEPEIAQLVQVGTYPSTRQMLITETFADGSVSHYFDAGQLKLSDGNPLNLVLKNIDSPRAQIYLIEDGSDKIKSYFLAKAENSTEEAEMADDALRPEELMLRKSKVVMIDDIKDLSEYIDSMSKPDSSLNYFVTTDIFSNTKSIIYAVDTARLALKLILAILLVSVTIIMIVIFAGLLEQDATLIATLYKKRKATTSGVYLGYLLFLLELCVLAVVGAVIVSCILAFIVTLTGADGLSIALQEFYELPQLPKVNLFGFDHSFWWTILTLVMAVLVGFGFMTHKIPSPSKAKRMKK